ncbi:MAG: ISKra4 family transposase [Blastocatellia bacterium]
MYIEIDGTGVPIVSWELDQSKPGKQGDRPRGREARLGCVFTQTSVNAEGRPIRDPFSTTYTGAIETAEEFARRIYAEARRRGLDRAMLIVVIGDGAPWIWSIARTHFPGAVEILDLYHAREHLWNLAAKLFPSDEVGRKRWVKRFQHRLDNGKIEELVRELRSIRTTKKGLRKAIQTEADYYEKNTDRMRYPDFKRQKLFVGSGVIEAGCKTVIGSRLKGSGMFWTIRGANAILALRCAILSRDFDDYWESRRA